MLNYKFSKTSQCKSDEVGKYAKILKFPYEDRFHHICNSYITIYDNEYKTVKPLEIKIFCGGGGELSVTKLNKSDIDVFIRIENNYYVLYVSSPYKDCVLVCKYVSGENANMYTPIIGCKFTEDFTDGDIKSLDNFNPQKLSGKIKNKYFKLFKVTRKNIKDLSWCVFPLSIYLHKAYDFGGRSDITTFIGMNEHSTDWQRNIDILTNATEQFYANIVMTKQGADHYVYIEVENVAYYDIFNIPCLSDFCNNDWTIEYFFNNVSTLDGDVVIRKNLFNIN